jgi:transposase
MGDGTRGAKCRARQDGTGARPSLIQKVYEVDPLVCPHCGSNMKIVAIITSTAECRKIVEHLRKKLGHG